MFEEMDCLLAQVAEAVGGEPDSVGEVLTWDRVISWAQAMQLVAMGDVAATAPAWIVTDEGRSRFSGVDLAAAELAPGLGVGRVAAGNRVALAVQAGERLPDSLAALAAGAITLPKLRAIEEATSILTPELARKVEATVLPVASEHTVGQLVAALRKAVIQVDPAAAEKRRKKAIAGRSVRVVPQPDGVAGLWALMPAEHTAAAFTVIDSIARLAKVPGETRGMDELRTDALYDVVLHAHDQLTGRIPTGLLADALARTDRGTSNEPDARSSESVDGPPRRRGRQRSTRLYAVQVTVPARTLTGDGEEPGDLPGYGPITADAARGLAADDATWHTSLVDAITGTILHVGRNRYRPPVGLARLVLARDRTCRFPGCRQPAWRCDLDHCRRYPEGPTAHWNLAALCRHHHGLKHHTRWKVELDSAGVVTWTSPTGRTHITYPWRYDAAPWLAEAPPEQIYEHDLLDLTAIDQ